LIPAIYKSRVPKILRGKIGLLKITFLLAYKGFPMRLALTSDIHIEALHRLPTSTYFPHPYGITLGKGFRCGVNCIIAQNVTVGARYPNIVLNGKIDGTPVIGNNVMLCANVTLLGPIHVGDNCIVGANALVLHDVPTGVVYK
jgi:serine acetyltransferase